VGLSLPHGRPRAALAAVAICAAAVVPYLSTLNNYFVRDDFGVVQLLASKPASYFPRWFVSSWMDGIWGFVADEVRPFPAVSYQLTMMNGGASPAAHHALNIAFHAANGLLLFALARSAARLSVEAAAFAALVFVLLPVHAEAVAWITGRVDSMPALFYVASLVFYVRWRGSGSTSHSDYAASVACCFVALFSKQTAITLLATLVAYDLLHQPRPVSPVRVVRWLRAYAPFGALTAGYLALRYMLFGDAVREESLSWQAFHAFGQLNRRHLARVVTGDAEAQSIALALVVVVLGGAWIAARWATIALPWRVRGSLVFFGPVWWAIGVAPTLVAGYESPRHVYLAAFGWAIALGIFAELVVPLVRPSWGKAVLTSAAAAVLLVYAIRLSAGVREWNTVAAVSHKVVDDVRDEARQTSAGSLIVIVAPTRSWEWALPFAMRPPFVPDDLTSRVFVVTSHPLWCCRSQWFDETRRTLRAWSGKPGAPMIAMRWDPETGALSRVSDREEPVLRAMVPLLLALPTSEALDAAIVRMATYLAPARR
jgi:hypothetical protein